MARSGSLKAVPKPKKVVHVGHSFGSALSNGLVASAPQLSDALVMTGFSHTANYLSLFETGLGWRIAKENNPARFGALSEGYITWGDMYDNQLAFLKYPFFDIESLKLAEETKAPFTFSEFFTIQSLPAAAANFTGPVFVRGVLSFCMHLIVLC
jgi:pimeloyl-ACP methyl ester carboxylesterase